MEEISRPRHLPTWNFIVGSNLDNHTREISAGEQVAQTYGNIIKGATGLKYFFGQLAGREHWQAFKQLNREAIELTPVILATDAARPITSSRPSVLATTRTVGGKAYVLSVNIENQPTEVAFDISALSCPDQSEVKVLFEDRTLVIHDNILRDKFDGFQRHIYELAPAPAR